MKKLIFICIVFVNIFGLSSISLAQGYAIFPQESLSNLFLMEIDVETDSFVFRNRNGEEITGYLGDFAGSEGAEIIKVTNKHITVQTIELIDNKNGKQHEQPSRMQIPVSFGLEGQGKGSR